MGTFLFDGPFVYGIELSGAELGLSSNVAMTMFIVSQGKKDTEPLRKILVFRKGK